MEMLADCTLRCRVLMRKLRCMFLDCGTGELKVQLFLGDFRNRSGISPRSVLYFGPEICFHVFNLVTATLFRFYLQSPEQHHLLLGAVDVFQQDGPARLLVHLCQAHNVVLHKQRHTAHMLSVRHRTHTDLGFYFIEGKIFKTKPNFVIFLNSLLQETSGWVQPPKRIKALKKNVFSWNGPLRFKKCSFQRLWPTSLLEAHKYSFLKGLSHLLWIWALSTTLAGR